MERVKFMKKILAVVLAALMIVSVPVVLYAVEVGARAVPEQYCSVCNQFSVPSCITYDGYEIVYDEATGEDLGHVYVYGYDAYCGSCGEFLFSYEMYREPDVTPHSFDARGYCYCGSTNHNQ